MPRCHTNIHLNKKMGWVLPVLNSTIGHLHVGFHSQSLSFPLTFQESLAAFHIRSSIGNLSTELILQPPLRWSRSPLTLKTPAMAGEALPVFLWGRKARWACRLWARAPTPPGRCGTRRGSPLRSRSRTRPCWGRTGVSAGCSPPARGKTASVLRGGG